MSSSHTRLKYVTRFAYGEALPTDELQDGPFPVFGSNGQFANFSRANTGSPAIIVGRKGSYGKVNWTDEACFASDTTFVVDERTTSHHLRWIYWMLQALELDTGSDEAAVPGLNRDNAYEREVLLPDLETQEATASFLDFEVQAVDTLIEAKQTLLGLLAEKRRTLVAEAVMRGLDRSAPLRPSGIDWLGDIPAHWEALNLKRLVVFVGSGVSVNATNQPAMMGEKGVLKTSSVLAGRFMPDENKAVWETELDRLACPVSANSIILSRMNTPNLVAQSGYVDRDYPDLFLPDRLWQLKFNEERAYVPYFSDLLASSILHSHIAEKATGTSASMKNLSQEDLLSTDVPLPPLAEQKQIVARIAEERVKIDKLATATERSIALLKERRSALIAAAVTGQIEIPEAA